MVLQGIGLILGAIAFSPEKHRNYAAYEIQGAVGCRNRLIDALGKRKCAEAHRQLICVREHIAGAIEHIEGAADRTIPGSNTLHRVILDLESLEVNFVKECLR